jgi:hypothetical protein
MSEDASELPNTNEGKPGIDDDTLKKVFFLELSRLIVTLVVDILCSVYIWNGGLGPGYATAAIVFKDWVSNLVLENHIGILVDTHLLSDMLRDVHCFCDIVMSVALSFYEAQMSLNDENEIGFPIKIAVAVGCAIHLPVWLCSMYFFRKFILIEKSPSQEDLITSFGVFTTTMSTVFQVFAWSLAVGVSGSNSVELALIAVALNKFSVFVASTPLDKTQVRWVKGALFALGTGVQVVLMNSRIDEPDSLECQRKCPLKYCRLGVSIISRSILTNHSSKSDSWPTKTTLPTERISGWLILDSESSCAHELLLSTSQSKLFISWTVAMSFSGVVVIALLIHSIHEATTGKKKTDDVTMDDSSPQSQGYKVGAQKTTSDIVILTQPPIIVKGSA